MQALILNGFPGDSPVGPAALPTATQPEADVAARLHATVEAQLQAAGYTVRSLLLKELKIRPCGGDFHCWYRHPGECQFDDDGRTVARLLMQSDLVVLLSPITFGCYSSLLKTALDRMIPNISPFFAEVAGETHHRRRYRRYPITVALGSLPSPDSEAEAIFRTLTDRNALTMRPRAHTAGVVDETMDAARIETEIAAALARVGVNA